MEIRILFCSTFRCFVLDVTVYTAWWNWFSFHINHDFGDDTQAPWICSPTSPYLKLQRQQTVWCTSKCSGIKDWGESRKKAGKEKPQPVDIIDPRSVGVTYGLVGTDGVDLGSEHHRGKYEEEEGLEAQEDEEDDCGRGRERTALWNVQEWGEGNRTQGGRGGRQREVRG